VRTCPIMARGQISQGKTRDLRPSSRRIYTQSFRMTSGSETNASLPTSTCLICASCASVRGFAFSFLQTPPRGGHPCCSARSSCHQGLQGTCTPKSLPGLLSLPG
jgi:hypothetical protein